MEPADMAHSTGKDEEAQMVGAWLGWVQPCRSNHPNELPRVLCVPDTTTFCAKMHFPAPCLQTAAAAAAGPPPPAGRFAGAKRAVGHVWDKVSYGLNFEWLNLGKRPSAILLALLLLGLALAVGLTGKPVENGVTLGVEFGGGYSLL